MLSKLQPDYTANLLGLWSALYSIVGRDAARICRPARYLIEAVCTRLAQHTSSCEAIAFVRSDIKNLRSHTAAEAVVLLRRVLTYCEHLESKLTPQILKCLIEATLVCVEEYVIAPSVSVDALKRNSDVEYDICTILHRVVGMSISDRRGGESFVDCMPLFRISANLLHSPRLNKVNLLNVCLLVI
jgi:hypothetical protein